MTQDQIFMSWPLGVLQAAWKPSMYNAAPLRKLVYRKLDDTAIRQAGKHLRIGATCLETGEYNVFDQRYPDVRGAILASCAFPGAFEPVQLLNGRHWIDGGAREVSPVKAALDAGASRIDVLVTSPRHSAPFTEHPLRSYDVVLRAVDVMSDEVLTNDLVAADFANRLVQAGRGMGMRDVELHILRPIDTLTTHLFDFKPATLHELFRKGYEDARHLTYGNLAFNPA